MCSASLQISLLIIKKKNQILLGDTSQLYIRYASLLLFVKCVGDMLALVALRKIVKPVSHVI